jgi:ubiquitin C-terminal hydrolase
VVSYLQIAELENLDSLMKETAPHDSIVAPAQQKDPEIEETLRNLGKLLFIQMHNHKGHPEAYIPVYDHLRQHLCVDANGNASELISTIEMDLQLKADSWAYVSSSSFNMFERSGNHNPIDLDDVDEQLEFSALSDDETDDARSDFKKAFGIAGLVNLGNTCYMNSVVQVLNQTISFRKAVFQGFEDAGTSTSLLRELQYTFAALCLTNRSAFAPRTLISTLPDWIKGGRQHDASELGKAIFGILDSHWTLTRKHLVHDRKSSEQVDDIKADEKVNEMAKVSKSPIERLFGGSVLTSVRCKSCGSISTRSEAILDLSLTFPVEEGDPPDGKRRKQSDGNPGSPAPVHKDSTASLTLETLLQHFMKAETMEGQNQYHCSTCQKLVDAEKIQQVSSAPDHLIVNLVRFRYDYKTQIRSKILTEVEFKEHLELPVLALHSSNAERLSSTPNENRMDIDGHPNEDNVEHPNHAVNIAESGTRLTTVSYTLYGCVMHSGRSVEHGHYYSYARASVDDEISPKSASSSGPSTTSPWFRFNDESVDSSSFESFSRITKHFPADVAYILLYKRNDMPCANPSPLEVSSPETALSTTYAIPATIVKRVQDDNEKAEVERRMRKKSATQTRQALFSTRSRFDDSPFGGGNGSGGGGLGGGPFGSVGPGGGLGGFGGWVS